MRVNKGPVVRLKNGKFKIDLANDHRQLLTQLIEQLRDSLTTTTDDANLRRLFPTAYNNDAKKDAEYQRLMRDELLASRLSSIETALKVIVANDELSGSEIDAFARSINSLRLVIGTSLDIAESESFDNPDASDTDESLKNPRQTEIAEEKLVQRELYDYLGWLLEWTVGAQSEGL